MNPLQALAALALASLMVAAQADEAIATDRPDFVESSDVVGAGRVQIELGLNFERDSNGSSRSRTRSTPALLRIGLGQTLEARIETDGLISTRSTDRNSGISTRDSGAADVALGLKWHMSDGDEKSGAPSTAWLLHLDLDSGSSAFRGQGRRPSLRFVAEWELAGDWSVGLMPGLARDTDDSGRHFTAGILAATASTALGPNWRGFAELAGQRLASKARGGNLITLDGGVTYQLSPDMQVDFSLQRGLTRQTPDFTAGIGWSARY